MLLLSISNRSFSVRESYETHGGRRVSEYVSGEDVGKKHEEEDFQLELV